MKCCDNPQIDVLYDPANDGINYETCGNCGVQTVIGELDKEITNRDAIIKRLSEENEALRKQAKQLREKITMAFNQHPALFE